MGEWGWVVIWVHSDVWEGNGGCGCGTIWVVWVEKGLVSEAVLYCS